MSETDPPKPQEKDRRQDARPSAHTRWRLIGVGAAVGLVVAAIALPGGKKREVPTRTPVPNAPGLASSPTPTTAPEATPTPGTYGLTPQAVENDPNAVNNHPYPPGRTRDGTPLDSIKTPDDPR